MSNEIEMKPSYVLHTFRNYDKFPRTTLVVWYFTGTTTKPNSHIHLSIVTTDCMMKHAIHGENVRNM